MIKFVPRFKDKHPFYHWFYTSWEGSEFKTNFDVSYGEHEFKCTLCNKIYIVKEETKKEYL